MKPPWLIGVQALLEHAGNLRDTAEVMEWNAFQATEAAGETKLAKAIERYGVKRSVANWTRVLEAMAKVQS